MFSLDEVTTYIKNFIVDELDDSSIVISGETNFVDDRLLDSFSILTLIMELESEFNIKFAPAELSDAALKTIDGLSSKAHLKTSNS